MIDVAELPIRAEGLHEPLHRAQIVDFAEARIGRAARSVEAAQVMAEQFLALFGGEIDVWIEEE